MRTGFLAATLAVSGSGTLMAADCGSVAGWITEFNKNGYHDCDGSPTDPTAVSACSHLSYVNQCCLQGSATAETQSCVEERCIGSVFTQLGNTNPLPGAADCTG